MVESFPTSCSWWQQVDILNFVIITLLGNGFLLDIQSNLFVFSQKEKTLSLNSHGKGQKDLKEERKLEDKKENKKKNNKAAKDNKDAKKSNKLWDESNIIVINLNKIANIQWFKIVTRLSELLYLC